MVEKYEVPELIYDEKTGKYDNVVMISSIGKDRIVLNNFHIIDIDKYYFYAIDKNGDYKSIFGQPLKKLEFNNYYQMYKIMKQKYLPQQVLESNLKLERRFLVDKVKIPLSKTPINKLYFDIETDFCLDFRTSPKPITSISTFSNKLMRFVVFVWRSDLEKKVLRFEKGEFTINKETGDKAKYPVSVYVFDNEFEMIEKYLEFVDNIRPHLQLGWNSNGFDFPYIINRCINLGLDYKKLALGGVIMRENDMTKKYDIILNGSYPFDMLEIYRKITANELDSYKLNTCAKDILGEDNVKLEVNLKDIWRTDWKTLVRYNIQDVNLLIDIDDSVGMVDLYDERRRIIGCDWYDLLNNTKLLDVWFLRKAKDSEIVLPDPNYGGFNEQYIGAYVMDPIAGVYKWVIGLDLSSLYPNIIIQFNLSPETIDTLGEIQLVKEKLQNFKSQSEQLGFVPQTIDELQKMRKKTREKMKNFEKGSNEYKILDNIQFTQKGVVNSIYGALGYPNFRLYNRDVATAITTMGQKIIQHTKEIIEGEGFKVIYADTDSNYVETGATCLEEAVEIGNKLRDVVNKSYDSFVQKYGCEKNIALNIEFESVSKDIYFAGVKGKTGTKKRYAYHQVWADGEEYDKVAFKGFEIVRSDAPKITKEVQKKFFEILFDEKINDNNKKQLFETWLKQFKQDLKDMKYSYNYFATPQTIKKRLNEYKVTNPFIRGADYANRFCDTNIDVDSKVRLIYLEGITNTPHTNEICYDDEYDFKMWLEENNVELIIDWKKIFEAFIDSKVRSLYSALAWSEIGQKTLPF